MATNPQASPILHHQNHLSLFHFRNTSPLPSFSSLHFTNLCLSSQLPQSEYQCNNRQVRRHVSTEPVEYSTPTPPESNDFLSEIDRLKALLSKLDVSKDLRRKDAVIDADSRVRRFFSENQSGLSKFLGSFGLNSKEIFFVKCVIAAALWGIEGLPDLGEIYPLGGAADRLGLVDSETGECLPAAMLAHCGRTLLEGLIRDLQAREFLYFRLNGKQCVTPVAIMTSAAKNNHEHKLGFTSCKRNAGATEGINVLMEKKNFDGKWEYGMSCIEYTKFNKFGISSRSPSSNGLQADFPANTNILYVDLHAAELVGSSSSAKSLPNMVLNTKKRIEYIDQYGDYHSVLGGRLECTMQNIADNFLNKFPSRCQGNLEDKLDTYIVYNERRKVTSSAKKKKPHASAALHQTPDGALLDVLRNAYDLLTECDIKLPMIKPNDMYVDSPPPYLILLHPALGPLWEVTRQKFKGGSIANCSELQLEIAEFSWNNVQVDGSLIITAENAMGSTTPNDNGEPILQYGLRCGKCKLHNVKVVNQGIDWNSKSNVYWRNDVNRLETCKIILHGNAEFEASNVTIEGNHVFEVPDRHKLKITPGNSGLSINLEPMKEEVMETGSWYWSYQLNGSHIHLEQVEVSQN